MYTCTCVTTSFSLQQLCTLVNVLNAQTHRAAHLRARVVNKEARSMWWVSGCNMECLPVDHHGGQHVWRVSHFLYAIDLFCRFLKIQMQQAYCNCYKRLYFSSLSNSPYFSDAAKSPSFTSIYMYNYVVFIPVYY